MTDIEQRTNEKAGILARMWQWIKGVFTDFNSKMIDIYENGKKIGKDDPRKIIHCFKVGLALTVVSLLYYFKALYQGFGAASMWAVLTVVVISEYTVGATLGKGLNRAIATFSAGLLAVGVHRLVSFAGDITEPILLGILVFLIGAAATFCRFFPVIKARYDYGALIFILTFSLVSVSGYRSDEIIDLADQRLATIAIGVVTCIFISIFICPVWAGEDLHKLIALNIEKLATYLTIFPGEYFKNEMRKNEDKSFLQGYKSILNSKGTEESLANFARWEPGHGHFGFRHPWKQYLKIGSLTRQCAYRIEALNGCMTSDVRVPAEFRQKIQVVCTEMSKEASATLTVLASSIRTMMKPSSIGPDVVGVSKAVADSLKTALSENTAILEILPDTVVTSLLLEIVSYVEKIAESVDQLARLAKFKSKTLPKSAMKPFSDTDSPQIVITVEGPPLENVGPCQPMRS